MGIFSFRVILNIEWIIQLVRVGCLFFVSHCAMCLRYMENFGKHQTSNECLIKYECLIKPTTKDVEFEMIVVRMELGK